jgi:hypothetical protein
MLRLWLVTLLLTAAVHRSDAIITLRGAFEPNAPFDVRVWGNFSSPSFVFPELADDDFGIPELQGKPRCAAGRARRTRVGPRAHCRRSLRSHSMGVALGGGGFRASVMALGWVRGLHEVRGHAGWGFEAGGGGGGSRFAAARLRADCGLRLQPARAAARRPTPPAAPLLPPCALPRRPACWAACAT